jgi:hypothetical protein
MAQALEALTAETPLVLSLEDLHWSDFSTLELISAIGRRTEPQSAPVRRLTRRNFFTGWRRHIAPPVDSTRRSIR